MQKKISAFQDELGYFESRCLLIVYFRREKEKKSRATVFITSGAMTFIVLAATLVTATFLMSPVIEEIFGRFW